MPPFPIFHSEFLGHGKQNHECGSKKNKINLTHLSTHLCVVPPPPPPPLPHPPSTEGILLITQFVSFFRFQTLHLYHVEEKLLRVFLAPKFIVFATKLSARKNLVSHCGPCHYRVVMEKFIFSYILVNNIFVFSKLWRKRKHFAIPPQKTNVTKFSRKLFRPFSSCHGEINILH